MAAHLTITEIQKTCFVHSYIIPAEDVNMPFFPWLHAVLIIPDDYFHKCKPIGKTSLKQNVKATSFWSFFTPGWVKSGAFSLDSLFSYQSRGRAHKIIHPKEHKSKLSLP